MAHKVICLYCKKEFDRDSNPYVMPTARRYAHAECYQRKKNEEKDFNVNLDIIDPSIQTCCFFCKQKINKNSEDVAEFRKNVYAHQSCIEKDNNREKTDSEILDEYIIKLFNLEYVNPGLRKEIKKFIEEYHYSYSGIQKALIYYYEIKHNDISKANGHLGIVPFIYEQAFRYYYDLWLSQQKNENKDINQYIPKIIEIKIPIPQAKMKKRKNFSFLDKEE